MNKVEQMLLSAMESGPLTIESLEMIPEFTALQPVDYAYYVQMIHRIRTELPNGYAIREAGKGSQKKNIYPVYELVKLE